MAHAFALKLINLNAISSCASRNDRVMRFAARVSDRLALEINEFLVPPHTFPNDATYRWIITQSFQKFARYIWLRAGIKYTKLKIEFYYLFLEFEN